LAVTLLAQYNSFGRSKATISQKKSFALWRKHCDLDQPRLPASVLPTQELPTLELLALGLLTRGLTLGLVLQELRVEMLALLLLLGESVLAVLLVDRTDASLSDHLLLTLGLTLGLVLRKLQVETRALLLILNNSVLTVLLVDRTETPLSDHLRHGTLQSAATPWESSEQSKDAKGVLASSNCSHSKSNFGDQNAHAGTANSAGAMTTEERSSMSSTLLSHLSCKVKDFFCEMVAFERPKELYCANNVTAKPISIQLQPLNGRMPRFPSCGDGSPKTACPDQARKSRSCESSSTRVNVVPGALDQTETVTVMRSADAWTGVGACANSVLAVSPVGPSKTQFCMSLQGVHFCEVQTI